jgi:hypothetical protein
MAEIRKEQESKKTEKIGCSYANLAMCPDCVSVVRG